MKHIIVGTAGHIDHGKTTLIKALTGRETDTLDEEKKRGISINLGFTFFDLPSGKRVGIVDVPGHEKFIKNMLAGASGLDMVMLVVAADEGVMPQTVEHIDILSFLNIKNGMVVLTKSDMVDDDFRELVKEDIKERLKGTFLENAEILEVDSVSKRGIPELIEKLDEMSEQIEEKNENSPARLNIDRVFTIKGHGTVVTGTLIEGKISVDDDLVIYPEKIKAKIRSIQVHGENENTAYAGQRTAINISNVKKDEIERGDVLAAADSLEESMMLDVRISMIKHAEKPLKHWDRVRLYHGTREILCRAVPLEGEEIAPGESGFVQLRLEESIVCKKGDTFVIRSYSPMTTIGGGVIIDASPRKHKISDKDVIEALKVKEKGELHDILEEYLKNNSKNYPTVKDMMSYSGAHEEDVKNALEKLESESKAVSVLNLYMHATHYRKLGEKIEETLRDYHKHNRLKKGMLKEELKSKVESKFKTKEFDVILSRFESEGVIKISGNIVSMSDFEVVFNDKQKETRKRIQNKLKKCGFESVPTMDEITEGDVRTKEVLEAMIGESVEILGDGYIMDSDTYKKAKQMLIDYIKEHGEITLGEYRDLIGSSRKNCMIILESFDRNRITKRIENKRVLM
ncbi:selenocysteine-specific translation elongation factor [Peptacetobacter hominis]|uniref:Selenocysteine-specific elongation factor n=1 Tax=Peptacetobacter hominis TaxID=2743610 RepID=A0A544QYB9_9FIRM|nr:selenocysteine-specific translation elongation factor [Peptacetobacter hominis]TQQ85693.1 selenocysteine-specific translation elongation factor [Peptacetobacter hominis]